MNLYLRIFLQKMQFRLKSCYIVLFACELTALLLCIGPFVRLEDTGEILTGFSFLSSNSLGNFLFISITALIAEILLIFFSGLIIFKPGLNGERSVFYGICVIGPLALLAPGVLSLYYTISYATGGIDITILPCAWIYLCLFILVYVPFFVLHRFQLGGMEAQPLFGTFLDEDVRPKAEKDEGKTADNDSDDLGQTVVDVGESSLSSNDKHMDANEDNN